MILDSPKPVLLVKSQKSATGLKPKILFPENEIENVSSVYDAGKDDLKSDFLSLVTRLQELLPHVTSHLLEKGRLREWVNFFELVNNGQFDVTCLASELFWDVVAFHSCSNIHAMRFSDKVKEFWATGMSLFHSKFIRFMGGFKCLGQQSDSGSHSSLKPDNASVNFVCPDVKQLRDIKNEHSPDCDAPGIMLKNLDAIAKISNEQKTYKICIDGKKITPGFGSVLGEVDLFGHEANSKLLQRKMELKEQKTVIQFFLEILHFLPPDLLLTELSDIINKKKLYDMIVKIVNFLTNRISSLRGMKVKKSLAVNKFMVNK